MLQGYRVENEIMGRTIIFEHYRRLDVIQRSIAKEK